MAHLIRIDFIVNTDDKDEARELQEEFANTAIAYEETLALHAHVPRAWHGDFPAAEDES